MASASDIGAAGSQYVGNAALGGGNFGVADIDTRPLQQLAHYTYLYNKAEYEQKQRDAEQAAKDLADLTSYDLSTAIPEDRKIIQERYDKLYNYVKANPTVMDYKNNKAGWMEYNKLRGDFVDDLSGAKARSLIYKARMEAEVIGEKNPERAADNLKKLNEEARSTDLRTPLYHAQQYDISIPDIPKTGEGLTFDVYKAGPNLDQRREFKLFNVPAARARASVYALGLDAAIVDVTSADFKGKDPETQKRIVEANAQRAIAGKDNFWVKGTDEFNAAIGAFKKTDGSIDESKIKGLPNQLLNLVKETNKYLVEKQGEIENKVYQDKIGNGISFGAALNKEDYRPINYADGISPDELALVAQYAAWAGDQHKTATVQHDTGIQQTAAAETRRHNKATEGLSRDALDLDREKWEEQTKGGEVVKSAAWIRAENIFKDVTKLGDVTFADGSVGIRPDQIRKLNGEQRKYLGLEGFAVLTDAEGKPLKDNSGKPITDNSLKPLKVTDKDMVIITADGELRVLRNATYDEKIKSWKGKYDNKANTNVRNTATNIVNEENVKAGAKEINSYMPIDLGTGGIESNTSGGSQTQSGGTQKSTKIKITVPGL